MRCGMKAGPPFTVSQRPDAVDVGLEAAIDLEDRLCWFDPVCRGQGLLCWTAAVATRKWEPSTVVSIAALCKLRTSPLFFLSLALYGHQQEPHALRFKAFCSSAAPPDLLWDNLVVALYHRHALPKRANICQLRPTSLHQSTSNAPALPSVPYGFMVR